MEDITNGSSCSCNYIKDTIMKIDKLQKEAILDDSQACIGCQRSLLAATYNTIPVIFRCCSDVFVGDIGTTGNVTRYFRIESVRCGQYVTVRLLELSNNTLVGTDYTMTIDIDCIKTIQCLEPISVAVCTGQN